MDKAQILAQIVQQSAPNKSEQNPHGFCYLPDSYTAVVTELNNEELVQALVTQRQQDGSFPVRPTELGVKWVAAGAVAQVQQPVQQLPAVQHQPQTTSGQQHAATVAAVAVDDNIPVPDKQRFGRGTPGETLLDKYPFATMAVNGSFFVPEDNPPKKDDEGNVVPKHRAFSSTVSQANRKFHPKAYIIRQYTQPDGTVGARVWRTEDLQGERPTRPRKTKPAAPQPENPGQSAFNPGHEPAMLPGGFPAPGNPLFGGGPFAPQAFPQPGYPQPQPQPSQAAWGAPPPAGGPLPPYSE